jgi:hypothetical protein
MKHALALIAALAAPQAQALSCMRPDPILTLQQVMADPEPWVVLSGSLTYADADVPPPWDPANPEPPAFAPIPATFSGHSLTSGGFDRPFAADITLQIDCAGPWCGGPPGQAEFLLFARLLPDGRLSVPLGPCGMHVFAVPDAAMEQRIAICMGHGACEVTQ